ncbi:MAG: Gfo/Idh/MocA family oxidoreductase [Candidatus Sericytochromatia bacterium]|nr:Gfo/Idh/MocA family oxidoreductase [Candidatus Sericytochromatia bacterium]
MLTKEASPPLYTALIGCGHWGPNYLRVIQQLLGVEMRWAADLSPSRRESLSRQFPQVKMTDQVSDIWDDPAVQAVIVATPAASHPELVEAALKAGKHVLCEKPLTISPAESDALVALAAEKQRILMVGHTFLFNTGIRQLKTYLSEKKLGQLYYLHSTRTNLGPIRSDVGAIEDLASHDIAIFNYLLAALPEEVSARGHSCLPHAHTDLAFMTFAYPGGVLAHVHVSWLNPVKVRQMTLVGSEKMVTWDDINVVEPIRIFDAGVMQEPYYHDFGQYQLLPKQGDTWIPRLQLSEPLKAEVEAFVAAIQTQSPPLSDGAFGADVVRVLEATRQSLAAGGAPVKIASA